MQFEEVVADSGKPIAHVCFPTGGFLSLLRPIEGNEIEVTLAGDEGIEQRLARWLLMTAIARIPNPFASPTNSSPTCWA